MSGMNTRKAYGAVAKSLHWTIFILVLIMIIGGFCLGYVPKEYKGVIYNLHKITGLIILALMLVRLVWGTDKCETVTASSHTSVAASR